MIPIVEDCQISCSEYTGPISIYLRDDEVSPLIDMEVHYRKVKDFDAIDSLADDDSFCATVIRVLKYADKLDVKKDYCLSRAEIGMQRNGCAIFECIYEERLGGDKNVSKEIKQAWLG